MISKILRWSGNALLALVLSLVLVIVAFRMAASIRETHTRADLAPRSGHLVPTNSGGVFVQEKGPADGIPVVLFHGSVAWSEFWRRSIDALAAAGFRVIALDVPPFGFSDRPGGYTRSEQAPRVNDVLRHLGLARPIIVGHSVGSGPATEFVMRYPDAARALVLIDPALGLTTSQSEPSVIFRPKWIREILISLTLTNPLATKPLLKSMIAKKDRALPEYIEILWQPWTLRESTPEFADWLYDFLGSESKALSADRASYPRLKIPVALLWGEADTITPIDQAHDLQKLVPQATLTVLPGLGHIPQIEDPAAFNDALLKVVGKL